ncbi:hypothetical protein DPEC_G00172940 [Dallia pectoralis]|uniref:Uncharacterized protein n=1 Tax=Dallia pectoralis TaxID=75939 RepID=A0ACC2GE30_DALPE|nr:hypothetical protein DPEC_G00172940 [Dallia pectoralis]
MKDHSQVYQTKQIRQHHLTMRGITSTHQNVPQENGLCSGFSPPKAADSKPHHRLAPIQQRSLNNHPDRSRVASIDQGRETSHYYHMNFQACRLLLSRQGDFVMTSPYPLECICQWKFHRAVAENGLNRILTTIDMSESVIPPEVRPKPVVPAKPPHVAAPSPTAPHGPSGLGGLGAGMGYGTGADRAPGSGHQGGGSTLLGYIGIDTIIEQMRKKTMKAGFDFNIMIVGQSGLGKSTLVNTLFKSQVSRWSAAWGGEFKLPKTVEIKAVSHVIEEGGVKMKLTVIDTPGFGDQINNDNCWEPISKYINEQYEKFLKEEVNIARKKRIPDTRVHCCLYFISPTGHSLRQLDIEFMKHLSRTVNIVPIIAKSDTMTPDEKNEFKQRVRKELEVCGIEFYPQKEFDDDMEDKNENDKIREAMPFAVVGSDKEYQVNGKRVLGRKTAWGVIEVENPIHCEFALLRDFLIRTHLQDLKEITHNIHYETYRAKRLNENGGLHPISVNNSHDSNL